MVLNSSSAIWNLGGLTYLQKKKRMKNAWLEEQKIWKKLGGKKVFEGM